MQRTDFRHQTAKSAPAFYPSVDCGPIDCSKAKRLLNWQPSSIVIIISYLIINTHKHTKRAKQSQKQLNSLFNRKGSIKVKKNMPKANLRRN
jgi:hypothetical protein